MNTDHTPNLKLDDIYKTPVGELLSLSDDRLNALISQAEEDFEKARKLKSWLKGIKRQKTSQKK